MTAQEIEAILADRYKGRGWAKFFQYMPMTSFESTLNKIDLVAVGLWHKHDKIIAFEIKIERSDFLKDLKQFKKKHQYALRISDEFFYVCPWGLIDKQEVPETAGLMYVNKGNKIKIMKPAQVRIIQHIPFQLFQGFAREFGNKIDYTKIPIKYLGKDIMQDDLMAIVEEKREWDFHAKIETKAKEMIEKTEKKKGARDQFLRELLQISYHIEEKDSYPELLKYCKLGREMATNYDFLYHLDQMKKEVEKLMDIINKKKEKS